MLTLVASALAGGDCIDDADVLRTGGTAQTLGCVVKAPSTHRSCAASGGATSANWIGSAATGLISAGAGPGDAPFTIDRNLRDGLTATPQEGLSPAVGRGRWHRRRADGPAARGPGQYRGAAHFLRETVGRVRHAGARGQLTVRADSGFYTHGRRLPPDGCPLLHHHPAYGDMKNIRTPRSRASPNVRRVKPTPGSQLGGFITAWHSTLFEPPSRWILMTCR